MCSLLQPQAVLPETDGTYVAPSVGLIPASASPRDVNLQNTTATVTDICPPIPTYPPPPTRVLLLSLRISVRQSHASFTPPAAIPFFPPPLPVRELRAPLVFSPKPDGIFMTLANRAEGRRKTPGRLRQSSLSFYLCSKYTTRE